MDTTPSVTVSVDKHNMPRWIGAVGVLVALAIGIHTCTGAGGDHAKAPAAQTQGQADGVTNIVQAPKAPTPAIEPGTACEPFVGQSMTCTIGVQGSRTIVMGSEESAAGDKFCFAPTDPSLFNKVEYLDANGVYQIFDFKNEPHGIGGMRFFPRKEMTIRYIAGEGSCP